MYSDVREAVGKCEVCKSEDGVTAVSAWTRTTLYTCPFQALEFDFLTVPQSSAGHSHLLVVVCLFSRWLWAVPCVDERAETVAEALVNHVFAPYNVWPSVLRSDNAHDFTGEVVRYVNRRLEIRHITGASYHPQAQGAVERKNRTVVNLMRKFLHDHAGDWELRLPALLGAIRATPMTCLGGRSPMEVVMGIKPQLPATVQSRLPVEEIGATKYVRALLDYLEVTHREVLELARERAVEHEGKDAGRVDTLKRGDVVKVVQKGRSCS